MKGKDILLGMSFISDELVHEADSQPIRKITSGKTWLPLAACFCLILGAASLFGALMPGMNNSMQESVVLDNELITGGQYSLMESGLGDGSSTLWNFAVSRETLLPNSINGTIIYGNSLPEGSGSLQLYTEKTTSSLLPTGQLTAGQTQYQPDSRESTWICGTEVQLFLSDNGTLLAQFVIPCNETEYLLVTAVSDSLAEDRFLQAVSEIIEKQEVIP